MNVYNLRNCPNENTSINKKQISEKLKILNDIDEDSIERKKSDKLIRFVLYDGRETIKNTRKKVEKKLNKKLKE